ncbi:hypothetical protein HYS79_01325 [Patescibacteria group bacterium]|nr:hypothetical protein [Patescibacteria group bacterium]
MYEVCRTADFRGTCGAVCRSVVVCWPPCTKTAGKRVYYWYGAYEQCIYRGRGYPSPVHLRRRQNQEFVLYALKTTLGLAPGASKPKVLSAIQGSVLAQAQLIGTYKKKQ